MVYYTITINFEVPRPDMSTTSTRRIERDVKKRDYAPVFRDSGSEVKFPGMHCTIYYTHNAHAHR